MKILTAIVALVAIVVIFMIYKNTKIPFGLGVTNGKLKDVPKSPNAVSSQTDVVEKKVEPFPFKETIEKTKESIKKILKEYGNIKIVKEEEDYIHAVSTTSTMHYHDDLEFYFSENEKKVHFRSASRVGYSDMGVNRKRYEKLLVLYNEK